MLNVLLGVLQHVLSVEVQLPTWHDFALLLPETVLGSGVVPGAACCSSHSRC